MPHNALRLEAARASAALSPVLLASRRASTPIAGVHGRRQSGPGETFWQYRQALPGDPLHRIDWRRSARSDELYVREREWENAQALWMWVDQGRNMDFTSRKGAPSKRYRAQLIAAAMGSLLARSSERFGLIAKSGPSHAFRHEQGLMRFIRHLLRPEEDRRDYGSPPQVALGRRSAAIYLSDFFAPLDALARAMQAAADAEVSGALVQIVDPAEEAFPYRGRVLFESMGGALRYDADRAETLKEDYQSRLAERREALRALATQHGWGFAIHRTNEAVSVPLLWLHSSLSLAGPAWSAVS